MTETSLEESERLLDEARKRWHERSLFNSPVFIPKDLESKIRCSPSGKGGFPEGHLYLGRCEMPSSESAFFSLRFLPGDAYSKNVVRVGLQISDSSVIPYAVLLYEPSREIISDFVHYCKFSSTSLYWIDQLILFLPGRIGAFIENDGNAFGKKMREISHLFRHVELDSINNIEHLKTLAGEMDRTFIKEISFRDNPLDSLIDVEIESMGQPPLFDYLFSSFFSFK